MVVRDLLCVPVVLVSLEILLVYQEVDRFIYVGNLWRKLAGKMGRDILDERRVL